MTATIARGSRPSARELAAKVAALEESLTGLAHENALLKRRLFGIRTERSQTSELRLALGDLLATEGEAAGRARRGGGEGRRGGATGAQGPGHAAAARPAPNLFASNLPRVPVEIRNPGWRPRARG
ncbi:MAG: hypothetical protein HS111_20830 [Kofleriaceae bacterium]|nr:hypothetical protein [Kofleriaceae bacterium]